MNVCTIYEDRGVYGVALSNMVGSRQESSHDQLIIALSRP